MSSAAPILALTGVSRYYGAIIALDSISCSLHPGETVFLLGSNGAGKSTLLAICAGLLAASEGEVRLCGTSARRRASEQRRAVGFVNERPMLYGDLRVREALELVAAAASSESSVNEIIKALELTPHESKLIRQCSQGVLRRASLARAYLNRPLLWLLDEPFTHLDVRGQQLAVEMFREELKRGSTVLLASHEESLLRMFSGRTIYLQQGRLRPEVAELDHALSLLGKSPGGAQ